MRNAAAGDIGILDRVDIDRLAVRGSDQLLDPVARRQLNADVLSASIDAKSLPPYASTGTIRLIGKRAAYSRRKASRAGMAADRLTTSRPVRRAPPKSQKEIETVRRSASETGQPRCHDTPVMRAFWADDSGAIVAAKGGLAAAARAPNATDGSTKASRSTDAWRTKSGRGDSNSRGFCSQSRRATRLRYVPTPSVYEWSRRKLGSRVVVDSPYLPADSVSRTRGPAVGYVMVMAAAALFAVNGTVAKVGVLESGISPFRLTRLAARARSSGSA